MTSKKQQTIRVMLPPLEFGDKRTERILWRETGQKME